MTQFSYAMVLYAYNQADTVREAALSMLAQDCPPLDIYFSDDCSPDGTFRILQEVAAAYEGPHRVHLNRNPENLGVIGHVHRIFEICDADVIINCAGDDVSHTDRAARMIEVFEREHPLLACSHARVEDADGRPAPKVYAKAAFYHPHDALSVAISLELYLGATSAWHRDILRIFGPVRFEECFEDLVYGFRAALAGRLAVIDEELVTYRLGRGITNSGRGAEAESQIRARRQKELRRDIAVFSQRILDAETFGIAPTHPIMKRLSRTLEARKTRLAYVEGGNHIPFDIKRVYYLYDVPGGADRGEHAHKSLYQFVICMSGSFDMVLDDGFNSRRFHLNRKGAYADAGHVRGSLPLTERLADEVISLPMCPAQTDAQTDYVIDRVLGLA